MNKQRQRLDSTTVDIELTVDSNKPNELNLNDIIRQLKLSINESDETDNAYDFQDFMRSVEADEHAKQRLKEKIMELNFKVDKHLIELTLDEQNELLVWTEIIKYQYDELTFDEMLNTYYNYIERSDIQ